jgi:hypothetical protein
MGPIATPSNGYQYTLQGNVIDGGTDEHRFKWGITLHDSHYGLVKDNVVYNYGGAGLMTETGNESFNVIDGNFFNRTFGAGGRLDSRSAHSPPEFGFEGSGMWFAGPNNYVRNNVVTNDNSAASIVYGLNAMGSTRVPNFKGADTNVEGEYTTRTASNMVLLEQANSEVYGSINGIVIWNLCGVSGGYYPPDCQRSTIRDFKMWNTPNHSGFFYPTANLTFDGYVVRGTKEHLNSVHDSSIGLWFGDYATHNVEIRNADIQGMKVGIATPIFASGTALIENSYLRNVIDINVETMGAPGSGPDGRYLPPKKQVIRNVKFDLVPENLVSADNILRKIHMGYNLQSGAAGLSQLDETYVYDYDQNAGENFRLYYTQQRAEFIMEQTRNLAGTSLWLAGCPEAGMTNQQCHDQHGVATAGAIVPSNCLVTRPDITGYLCGMDGYVPTTTSPTVIVDYLGKTRDVVGEWNVQQPDGKMDGVFDVRFLGGSKTVKSLTLTMPGSAWSTDPAVYGWILGVASSSSGQLLNSSDRSVSLPVSNGSVLQAYASESYGFNSSYSYYLVAKYTDNTSSNFLLTIPQASASSGGDTVPPTVSLTSPAAGTSVSGTVHISATASDNVGVSKVDFYVDGALKGTDTSTPYSYDWDTTNGGTHHCNGAHTHAVMARASDAAGNLGSSTVTVNMNNPAHCANPPPPPTLVGDINGDCLVNSLDFSIMNSKWLTNDATADLNRDGLVNSIDFSLMNANWFRGC